MSDRRQLQKTNKKLPECYMQGVRVSVTAGAPSRPQHSVQFLIYSAMSNGGFVVSSGSSVELGHLPPFWAVMLSSRDAGNIVNMHPYMEDYKMPHPVSSMHGNVKFGVTLHVKMPFLTN